jgi:outer membrane protein assembly complex protein YaeT
LWLAALALVAWSVSAATAQSIDRLLGRVVSEVRLVSGGQEVRDAQLDGLIEIRTGQPLTMASVRETIVHVMGMGRFLDVRVSAFEAGEAVRVEIEFVVLRSVRRVLFAGDLGLSEGTVRAAVVERFGPTPAFRRATDIAQAVEVLLEDHGYLRAVVRPRVRGASDADAGDMVFDVAAGAQARVGKVAFSPAESDAVRALRDRLNIRPGARYDPAELRKQLASFTDSLRARNYLEARADPPGVQESESGDSVDLTITLTQGPMVPPVEFKGDPLPPKRRADLVPVAREASVDQDLLEDSELRIEEYLAAQGYRDANAEFEKIPEGDRLRIVFTVTNGPLYRVSGAPQFEGNALVPEADLRPLVGLVVGQPFTQARLDADKAALLAEYRRSGFGEVDCKPAAVPAPGERTAGEVPVVVAFRIIEGPRTLVSEVDLAGNTVLPDSEVRAGLATFEGAPLFEPAVEADRDRILVKYLNLGYRLARIASTTALSGDRTGAHVRFTIREGPQIIVDHILVVGNDRIGDATIRREVTLQPGQPLGLEAISESQRRLAALGLFRRVTISELQHGSDHLRDVLVAVEESPATSIGYGGGVEFQRVDQIAEFAPRGFFEIGRRNLWGKNRSVNLFSRVSFRRRSETVAPAESLPATEQPQTNLEYRVIGSYREPKVAGSSADLQVALAFEQGSQTSYSFRRRSARVNLSKRYGPWWSLIGQYSIQRNIIYEDRINIVDRPLIDRVLPEIRIGSVSASGVRSTRDDAFDPGKGSLIGLNGELALRLLGSEVGFAKTLLQGFIYRQLPSSRRIVLAAGARLGLGTGFPHDVPRTDPNGDPILDSNGNPVTVPVRDLQASERFFAGGDTTVRGFQRDRLGRPDTLDSDGTPKGGHAEVILNGEVRVALWKDLGAVGFLDAGNVFAVVNDVRLGDLRAGAGFGIRYKSPVGPIRFDFGFKLGTLQTYRTNSEDRFALHISIGQAF